MLAHLLFKVYDKNSQWIRSLIVVIMCWQCNGRKYVCSHKYLDFFSLDNRKHSSVKKAANFQENNSWISYSGISQKLEWNSDELGISKSLNSVEVSFVYWNSFGHPSKNNLILLYLFLYHWFYNTDFHYFIFRLGLSI